MQEKWDYIDNVIISAEKEVQISDKYNEKLLEKLNKKKNKRNKFWLCINRPAASSFILSGVIIGILSINSVAYNLLNIEGKLKFQGSIYKYEYQYKIDAFKDEIGEWF
jgi:hypothetical protein